MAKPKKKNKPGRREERLVISGDPERALRELIKSKPKPPKKPKST